MVIAKSRRDSSFRCSPLGMIKKDWIIWVGEGAVLQPFHPPLKKGKAVIPNEVRNLKLLV